MTNGEKYTTVGERTEAFLKWCRESLMVDEDKYWEYAFKWLASEANKETLPCPFCGCTTILAHYPPNNNYVRCLNRSCQYTSGITDSGDDAIMLHNRFAKAANGDVAK